MTQSTNRGALRAPAPPDFGRVADAVGLESAWVLATHAERLLARVIERAPELEKSLEPVLSSRGGVLRLRGSTGRGAAELRWNEAEEPSGAGSLGDFRFEGWTRKSRGDYAAGFDFETIVGHSPEHVLAGVRTFIGELRGSDSAILAAFRRGYPRLHELAAALVDFEKISVIREADDHVAIRLVAPLRPWGIRTRYRSLDKVLAWAEAIDATLMDDSGRVLARLRFDGTRRIFGLDAFACGENLLWGDSRGPLPGAAGGAFQPFELDLTGVAELRIEVRATASILRLGPLRLGSYRLPGSVWHLRFTGSEPPDRGAWLLTVSEIEPPHPILGLFLSLERLHERLRKSFRLRVEESPHPEGGNRHRLRVELSVELFESVLLELVERIVRWGTRSPTFRDLIALSRDLAACLATDLGRLRSERAERGPGSAGLP